MLTQQHLYNIRQRLIPFQLLQITSSETLHKLRVWLVQIRKICPIRDCWFTPQNTLTLKDTLCRTRIYFKNLSRQNLDVVYRLSFDYIHNGGEDKTLKWAIIATFRPPRPWSWIGSYGIPSCSTYRPLPTHKISLKSEKLFVDGRMHIVHKYMDGHWDLLY